MNSVTLDALRLVHTLTFDVFGTILDLGRGHAPRLRAFLESKTSDTTAAQLWARWRNRQRIEQYRTISSIPATMATSMPHAAL